MTPIKITGPVFDKQGQCILKLAPILAVYEAFTVNNYCPDRVSVGRYIDLPAAVLEYFSGKFGKTGRDLVRKGTQVLSLGPYSLHGKKITSRQGFAGLVRAGIDYTLTTCGGLMYFNCGVVADCSPDVLDEAMALATEWLPGLVAREIQEITL